MTHTRAKAYLSFLDAEMLTKDDYENADNRWLETLSDAAVVRHQTLMNINNYEDAMHYYGINSYLPIDKNRYLIQIFPLIVADEFNREYFEKQIRWLRNFLVENDIKSVAVSRNCFDHFSIDNFGDKLLKRYFQNGDIDIYRYKPLK